jgi:hypothetical protein
LGADGTDVDDAATGTSKLGRCDHRRKEAALQIGVDNGVPILFGFIDRRRKTDGTNEARCVHKNLHAAEVGEGSFHIASTPHIGTSPLNGWTKSLRRRRQFSFVPADEDDGISGFRQRFRDAESYATRAPGHDRHLPFRHFEPSNYQQTSSKKWSKRSDMSNTLDRSV